jgi:hypothetical protein
VIDVFHHTNDYGEPVIVDLTVTDEHDHDASSVSHVTSHKYAPSHVWRDALDWRRTRAQKRLDKAARKIGRTAKSMGDTANRLAVHERSIAMAPSVLHTSRGLGAAPVAALRAEAGELHERLAHETQAGFTLHRGMARAYLAIPWVVAIVDFVVLSYFLADLQNITDAEMHSVGTWISLKGGTAIGLALVASVSALLWLSMLGEQLKARRGPRGEVLWSTLGALLVAQLIVAVILLAALGGLMFNRIDAKLVGHTEHDRLLAALFVTLSVVANLSVVVIHALDGSPLTERLDRLGRLVTKAEVNLGRDQNGADRERETLRRQGMRVRLLAAAALTRARGELDAAGSGGRNAGFGPVVTAIPQQTRNASAEPHGTVTSCPDGAHASSVLCLCGLAAALHEVSAIESRVLAGREVTLRRP